MNYIFVLNWDYGSVVEHSLFTLWIFVTLIGSVYNGSLNMTFTWVVKLGLFGDLIETSQFVWAHYFGVIYNNATEFSFLYSENGSFSGFQKPISL